MQSKTVKTLPKGLPMVHHLLVEAVMLTNKAVTASEEEIRINSRSKSARMRVLEKVK
jgi:16S rRNA C1402 N4-methylase RsmH